MAMMCPTGPVLWDHDDGGKGQSRGVPDREGILNFWDDSGCEKPMNVGSWQAKGGTGEMVNGK